VSFIRECIGRRGAARKYYAALGGRSGSTNAILRLALRIPDAHIPDQTWADPGVGLLA
jgi:hypothetical protein